MPKKQDAKLQTHHRSKYVAPSQQFSDWATEFDLERNFLGRWLMYVNRRYGVKRLAGIFAFCLFLSFLVLVDVGSLYSLQVGQPAGRDVLSSVNIEIVDELATFEKQANEELAQPSIFDYDPSINEELLHLFPEASHQLRVELKRLPINTKNGPNSKMVLHALQADFEKLLGRSVPEQSFKWLVNREFDNSIEAVVANAISVWRTEKLISNLNDFVPKNQKAIAIRDLGRKDSEIERLNKFAVKDLQKKEDFNNALHIFGFEQLTSVDQKEIDILTRAILLPNLTYNKKETEVLKQQAREAVIPVVISIKKNQSVIKEGQIVRPTHLYILSKIEEYQDSLSSFGRIMVVASLLFTLIMVFLSYIRRFTLNRLRIESKDIIIMGVVGVLVVVVTKSFMLLSAHILVPHFKNTVPEDFFMFLAPVAAGAMMVGLLITAGEVVWLFSLFLSLVLAILVDFDFSFLVFALTGGIVAARAVFGCHSRTDVYKAGLRVGLVNMFTVFFTSFIIRAKVGPIDSSAFWVIGAGFASGILSALTTMMLIPLIETVFNVTTDVKLMELSNLNHPLLKAMIVNAPGTYHHSLIVGAMCEAAGDEIGANSLLAKVMSYYHDIGKMDHAQYFIENQKPDYNPHDQISPYMSKTILIAHVKDGAELGMKHKLGKPIIDGILQHHGTTLISYFYNRALEAQVESIDQVNEEDFRYPGPKPQFREAALVMLADSVEAAARSLEDPTPSRLNNIVKNIIHRKFSDGQLDDCDLTLRDLTVIEQCFNRILLGVYHQRLDYSKKFGGGASEPATDISKWTAPLRTGRGSATS